MGTQHATATRQNGIVLVAGLLLLLVMTLIGLSAARAVFLEERMAGSSTDHQRAFQAAEAALRHGEMRLQQPTLPTINDTGGYFHAREFIAPAQMPYWQLWQGAREMDHWTDHAIAYFGDDRDPEMQARPSAHFYIEAFPLVYAPGESLAADVPVDELRLYRITARGTGINASNTSILQSTFKR